MSEDRAADVISRGDPGEIIGMAVGALMSAEEGRYCRCHEPILHGYDLMCGRCLLENETQYQRATDRMNSPHPYETRPDLAEIEMCTVCSGWKDDQRHEAKP